MSLVVLFNKPFDVLSQFTDKSKRATLANFIDRPGVYVAGRLDRDSEGLLMLTDAPALQHKITHPKFKVSKTYWAQVEGNPSNLTLQPLRDGLVLKDGLTKPANVSLIEEPDPLWPRHPPIRQRAKIPTQWLEITISEGRNRQIRRMCAAINTPVLRLIRYRIGSWTLDGLAPGEHVIIASK